MHQRPRSLTLAAQPSAPTRLTEEEAAGDVVIQRPGDPARRVVSRLELIDDNDPVWFDVLIVERV